MPRIYAFWGESGNPREINSSGRYFTYGWKHLMYPRQWLGETTSRWDDDMSWFGGNPKGLCHRGPWGSPDPNGKKVEFNGYYRCQNTKKLDHLTDGHEDTWGEWREEQGDLRWVAYLGKFYTGMVNWPCDRWHYQMWYAIRPCHVAGVEVGIDSLSWEITNDRVKVADQAQSTANTIPVWGESAPSVQLADKWPTNANIILVDSSFDDVVNGTKVDVAWANQRGLDYMIWGLFTLKGLAPTQRVDKIKAWLADGYSVATNIQWLRDAGVKADEMYSVIS
jgi:hypothetical protein